jgi:hypothetical protein
MSKIVLIKKKQGKHPSCTMVAYKFFKSVEEAEKYMYENRLNPNLNNGYRHIIINFNELREME